MITVAKHPPTQDDFESKTVASEDTATYGEEKKI